MTSVRTNYTDLSGVFAVQDNYFKNLVTGVNDPDTKDKIAAFQKNMDNLNTGIKQANVSTTQVLTQQQKVGDIVEMEKNRLLLKKKSIDGALESRNRAIVLNDSYKQRYVLYTSMVITVVVGLAIFAGLILLGKYLPVIPPFIITILCAIDIIIVMFICYFIYLDMLRRDPMNFNELNLDGPNMLSPDEIKTNQIKAQKYGDLLGSVNMGQCVGASCCVDGTTWDDASMGCIVSPPIGGAATISTGPNSFATIQLAYIRGEVKQKPLSGTSPKSPNEFERYAKL